LSQQFRPQRIERRTQFATFGSGSGIPVHDHDMPTAEIALHMPKRLARNALDAIAIDGAASSLLGDRQTETGPTDRRQRRITANQHGPVAIRKATVISEDSIVGASTRQPRGTGKRSFADR